jgi:hypothetical protein
MNLKIAVRSREEIVRFAATEVHAYDVHLSGGLASMLWQIPGVAQSFRFCWLSSIPRIAAWQSASKTPSQLVEALVPVEARGWENPCKRIAHPSKRSAGLAVMGGSLSS